MILLIFILNFIISGFNAWGCGRTWNETKYMGGFPHLMNWCAAIMACSGFTWCYLIIIGLIGSMYPTEDGVLLEQKTLEAFFNLGYLVIIAPVIGSGLFITIQSWVSLWRHRTFAHGAETAWNTFAEVYNISTAFRNIPDASGSVGDFFDSDSGKEGLILLLLLFAVCGGILTTVLIIKNTAKSVMYNKRFEYELRTI